MFPFAIPSMSTLLAGAAAVGVLILGLYFWYSQNKIANLEQQVATVQIAYTEEKKATEYLTQKMTEYAAQLEKYNNEVSQIRDIVNKRSTVVIRTVDSAKNKTPADIATDANKLTADQFNNLSRLSK